MTATSTAGPRFSLRGLLMTVAAVAIGLAFWRSEGCGVLHTLVTNMTFSPDGKYLVACCYEFGDANVPSKRYIADCHRYIMQYPLDETMQPYEIEHEFRGGELGPRSSSAFPTAFNFSTDGDRLFFTKWEMNKIQSWKAAAKTFEQPIDLSLWRGTALARIGGNNSFLVINSGTEVLQMDERGRITEIWNERIDHLGHFDTFPIAASTDGNIVALGNSRPEIWQLAPRKQIAKLTIHDEDSRTKGIAISPDDRRVAIAGSNGITLVDITTGEIEKVSEEYFGGCAFARDSNQLFVAGASLDVFDLTTNQSKPLGVLPRYPYALAACTQMNRLAIGTQDGIVLWGIDESRVLKTLRLPRGSYVPFFMPWLALVVWLLVAKRMWFPRPISGYERLRTQQRREQRRQAATLPGEDGA